MPQQQQSAPPKSEQVLTLSVPGGLERHLTSSHIKRLTWDEYICLYEVLGPLLAFRADSAQCSPRLTVIVRSM